jgi:purine-binding chemotaxis protein CheW
MKKSDESMHDVILFKSHEKLVAIEIEYLVEILESVPVSPLPFVPPFVEGLVNVNGKIMPQVNLGRLIFDSENITGSNGKTLLIVDIDGIPIALKIDQVKESITVDGTTIARAEETVKLSKGKSKKSSKASGVDYIIGTFQYLDEAVILFDALSLKDIIKSTAKPAGKQGFLGKVAQVKTQQELFNEYLITEVQAQEYAIDLEEVNEIVIMDSIRSQPRAPSMIVGVGLVRGEPRLIVSMAELLGQPRDKNITAGAVIMVKFNNILCGVLADKMVGLETIKQSQLKQNKEKNYLTVVREDGHTLTRVIQFSALFSEALLALIRPYMPNLKDATAQVEVKQIEMLLFEFAGNAYAFKLNDIRRVVSGKVIEPVLTRTGYIMGTMELEGKVVPVINLVNQLGYEESNIPITEYIVVKENGREWGLAIGECDQIVKIDENKIDIVNKEDARYVAAFSNYEDNLLTILNINAICHDNHHAGAA